jgi:hypothetical protein
MKKGPQGPLAKEIREARSAVNRWNADFSEKCSTESVT